MSLRHAIDIHREELMSHLQEEFLEQFELASGASTKRETALALTLVNDGLDEIEACHLGQSLVNYAEISKYIDDARDAATKVSDLLDRVFLEAFEGCGCRDPRDA